jgi:hypothetical protein
MSAYIVATVGPGKPRGCCSADRESAWSQDGQCVRGDPDVFAVVEVAESQELKKLVIGKIEKLKGVGGTSTHIALD